MSAPTTTKKTADTLSEEAVDLGSSKPSGAATAKEKNRAEESAQETKADSKAPRSVRSGIAGRPITKKMLASLAAAVVVVAVLATLIWMVVDKSSEISDMKAAAADNVHAEKVALDYSTGAAEMSYEDTQGWLARLTANTTPELGTRLRNAAGQMEQLLRPLQWSSTSSPISAKVTSVDGDVYKVDAFVGIVTKNVQAPADGVETTATYKLTIDKGQDWKITAITSNGTNLDAEGAAPADTAPAAPAAPTAPAAGN